MKLVKSDGGRSKYFRGKNAGDCVVRAICNATGRDYKMVYDDINRLAKGERRGSRKKGISSARNGVYKTTIKKYIENELGWTWVPTMEIGSGCKVHLREDELPNGTIIVSVARHLTCVKNGVLYDTFDCSKGGKTCVYGYWYNPIPRAIRRLYKHLGLTKTDEDMSIDMCGAIHIVGMNNKRYVLYGANRKDTHGICVDNMEVLSRDALLDVFDNYSVLYY